MNPILRVLFGIGLLLLSCVSPAQCRKVVSWRNDPPFLTQEADGHYGGIHADLIRETMRRMGCSVSFFDAPLARSLVELQAGRIDMVSGLADTAERKEYAWFSRPINFSRNVLFVEQGAAARYHLSHLSDIIGTGFRLGVINKALYGGDYDRLQSDPAFRGRLVVLTSRNIAWKMMAAGRLDGTIDNELAGLSQMQRDTALAGTHETGIVLSQEPDLVAFSRRTTAADFVAKFNQAFDDLIADGSFSAIFSQYAKCTVSTTKLGCQ